jgi:hypothetical protein
MAVAQSDTQRAEVNPTEAAEPVPLAETMRSLDERLAALTEELSDGTSEPMRAALELQIHALEQTVEDVAQATSSDSQEQGGAVNAEERSQALGALLTNLRALEEAAASNDMEAFRRAYKAVDLRNSCQACHAAYGKNIELPSLNQ